MGLRLWFLIYGGMMFGFLLGYLTRGVFALNDVAELETLRRLRINERLAAIAQERLTAESR